MSDTVLSLVIKGRPGVAARAASDRGLPLAYSNYLPVSRYTVGFVGAQWLEVVARWLAESNDLIEGQGFVDGTLLIYSEVPRPWK